MKRNSILKNISPINVGILYLILVTSLLLSCDAPHDNPLDPKSINPNSSVLQKDNPSTIHSFTTYSEHFAPDPNSSPLLDKYLVVVDIIVEDEDDISSVILEIADTLFYSMIPRDDIAVGLYRYIFNPKDLGQNIEYFRHAEIYAHIYDKSFFHIMSEKGLITAVHNDPPTHLYPLPFVTTSSTAHFIWQGPQYYQKNFSHFLIEIWDDSGNIRLKTYSIPLRDDVIATVVPIDTFYIPEESAFNNGDSLSWSIKVVDPNGNSSSSYKTTFYIERVPDE